MNWNKNVKLFFIGILAVLLVSMPVAGSAVMFREDPMHTGVYDDGGTRPLNILKWSYSTGNDVLSSPAVSEDVVYVGSMDGRVYALDAVTGAKIWHYATGDQVRSSPAVVNGVVYVGSNDEHVYALNAATGAKIWDYLTEGFVTSSPAVADGVVYICGGSRVYALNAATGAKIWDYATGNNIGSSPAIADGTVYVGSDDNKVYAIRASTGAKIWDYTTGSSVKSSPAVVNGIVYVGSTDGRVYAFDASTSAKIWDYTTGSSVKSSPAVANSVVYVGNNAGKLYALEATTGTKIWDYTTGSGIESSPAVANGIVYVGSDKLYALNADTGMKIWDRITGNNIFSSPAVANSVVFTGSGNSMYAIGVPNDHTIQLMQGWNFISTPKTLAPGSNTGSIFSNVNMGGHSAFMWDTSQNPPVWVAVTAATPIQPLYGIWIYSVSDTILTLNFDSTNPVVAPAQRSLPAGWNAIGFTGLTPTTARNTYISVQQNWVNSMGFDATTQSYEPAIFNGDQSESGTLYPTKGYWLYMRTPGILTAIGS